MVKQGEIPSQIDMISSVISLATLASDCKEMTVEDFLSHLKAKINKEFTEIDRISPEDDTFVSSIYLTNACIQAYLFLKSGIEVGAVSKRNKIKDIIPQIADMAYDMINDFVCLALEMHKDLSNME